MVGDRLGLFEVREVPRAEDSPTFVMYRSSPAMKLAVAGIARIRPGLAGLEASQCRAARRSAKAWIALHPARRARTLSGELRMVIY
ncbi:hypothetical protein [Streptomyces hawaiiensis]|uniref:hypothetical protein n=1 Tax=Streptomyces hawaiiensis TaxID=67305 RepID=UPI00365CED58